MLNTSPYYFVRSGYVDDTRLYAFASNGYYWSSTAAGSSIAYYLLYYSGALYPAGQANRYFGFSLRCVARSSGFYKESNSLSEYTFNL